jgi:hypothetical protein
VGVYSDNFAIDEDHVGGIVACGGWGLCGAGEGECKQSAKYEARKSFGVVEHGAPLGGE